MIISVHNRCSDFSSYRAARVKSLFNAESGCNFDLEAELPADDPTWKIGVIVGPSGSGKSTISKLIARFWDVQKGSITIGGENIKNIEPETRPSLTQSRPPGTSMP